MSSEEPTFGWEATPDAIIVRFPAPSPEHRSMGCATAFLLAAVILALPVPVMALWRLVEGAPGDGVTWIAYGVVMIVTGCLVWYAINGFREARLPPQPMEASLLSVAGGVLKIERCGRERDMDYSWEVSDISDIRLSAAAPDRIFLSIKSLLGQALFPDELIRISVESQSGEVNDVFVVAPGRFWPEALETRLRASLGLSTTAETPLTGIGES